MEIDIKVIISDIEVSERYYSFEYRIVSRGFIDADGVYEGDYDNGMTPEEWEEKLEEGEAVLLAIQTELC